MRDPGQVGGLGHLRRLQLHLRPGACARCVVSNGRTVARLGLGLGLRRLYPES